MGCGSSSTQKTSPETTSQKEANLDQESKPGDADRILFEDDDLKFVAPHRFNENLDELTFVIHLKNSETPESINPDSVQVASTMACCGSQADTSDLTVREVSPKEIEVSGIKFLGKKGKWITSVEFEVGSAHILAQFDYLNKIKTTKK